MLMAVYCAWWTWLAALYEWDLIFLNPIDLPWIISSIASEGVWSMRAWTPTGWQLYLIWLIEAGIIVVIACGAGLGEEIPFCEECDEWTETVDDAAGEALDKGAKLLGMPYPGGPLIEKMAEGGQADKFDFPRAMLHSSEVKFSFSGLKTSLRYRLEKLSDTELKDMLPDLCASYQQAVVDALTKKTQVVLKSDRFKSLGLSGGVANNQVLRQSFSSMADDEGVPLLVAKPNQTGDNAGMIAFAAFLDPAGTVSKDSQLCVEPAWRIG